MSYEERSGVMPDMWSWSVLVAGQNYVLTADALERESKAATGLPGGFAIPHCRSAAVTEASLAFARLARPVDFGAKDGPADLVFLIAAAADGDADHLKLLTKLARKEDMASVRLIILGGTTLPVKIAEDFMAKFGLSITEGYGLSEASPVVTLNPPGREKIGSIGLPLQGIKARIIDTEGHEVPTGEAGELIIQADTVMQGYWHLPEATAEALQDGWLHTSDVARQDEDGYIYIVDRLKDMIISMGENIYPREIEELVYQFPGIQEAAVIGIEDKLRGQAGSCFYSVQEGQTVSIRELKKFLQQNLALYKIPREFHEMTALPRTATGKIAKREILNSFSS